MALSETKRMNAPKWITQVRRLAGIISLLSALPASAEEKPELSLMGNRFLTFNTVVRVRQIEVTRNEAHGPDESSVHTPAEARTFREAIEKAWPGARITWAFSWLALHDERESYRELRELVVSYQKKFGDEITFIPGAYFSNMYNTREQVNRDLHEGLKRVSEIVGGGYRPKSVVAGFLSADNLRYLAEKEGIHVCQGNIWSQYRGRQRRWRRLDLLSLLSLARALLQTRARQGRLHRLREPRRLDGGFPLRADSRFAHGQW